ncbi:AMP-binding protein [Mesorhizobium sp. GR13]|uniref:class I adenylate-forming enzyme family protein n=1 Tax=Mesorhizobium sp. GR13 TaxID=2562308 RepID=UPI0010BF7A5A|nr:AMP-binding protein [Mesorhizobium sp. GR13]
MTKTVYDHLAAMIEAHADRVAICFEEETLTYRAFADAIEVAARHLRAFGIGKGSTFALYAQNRVEHMIAYYAAARLGAVFVPLNPNLTASEVEYAFRHSGATILFHDDFAGNVARAAVPVTSLRSLDELRAPTDGLAACKDAVVAPEDDFLIIYTSGSTGAPKAIVLDHAAQVKAAKALAEMWGLTPEDVTLVGLPLGYLYGLSTGAAVGLQAGGRVVILRRFHPRDVLEALVSHRVTIYHGVPTMFSMMLEYCEQRDLTYDLSGVRALICAGAPLAEEMRERFAQRFGKTIQDYYAATEATPVFGTYADDPTPIPKGAVGRAAPELKVRIVRPDGTDCGDDEDGEVLVRAAATMKRYFNNPEQTDAALYDGLFRTGDLGRRDREGYFYITGRIKDIIIRGGANISPSEVEAVISSHPAVQDIAVVGAPDRIFGEVPIAFVVLRHGASVTQEELVAHAEKTLSDFKVPRTILFESELPLGLTGKFDKKVLKARFQA